MRTPAVQSSLTAGLPWLAAFVILVAGHVNVVRNLGEGLVARSCPSTAPGADRQADIVAPAQAPMTPPVSSHVVYTVDRCLRESFPTGGDEDADPGALFQIRQLDATRFEIQRDAIDELLSDPPRRWGRIVPALRAGERIGYKLFGMRDCSLLRLLGLRNGDLVKRINGESLGVGQPTMATYAPLRRSDLVRLDIDRRGRAMTLWYAIVD